jgi:aspartate racemase
LLHIGIAACSAEGAALCYRTICTEGPALLGRAHDHPEVSVHTPPLPEYMEPSIAATGGRGGPDAGVGGKLQKIGADFVICRQHAAPGVSAACSRSPLPGCTSPRSSRRRTARGFQRPGLLARAGWCRAKSIRRTTRAHAAEREELNRIIMDELVCGMFCSRRSRSTSV